MAKQFTFTRREVMEDIVEKTGGRCLLAFSRGKDAVAAWLTLRESGLFHTIQPFHLNLIPGLKFIEESLDYFEDVFQTRIIRLPHISFYRMIGAAVYQPWERLELIHRLGFDECTRLTYNDVRRWLAEGLGWPEETTWTATGVRAADSPRRRIHIVKSKAKTFSSKQFFPIFDLNKQQTLEVIQRHGIKLPVDYDLWGRSFDGIDYRFVGSMKKHMPDEFERVRFWFPLIDIEILMNEQNERDGE